MQTLLEMCKHAADRAGIAQPSAIMTGTSDDARIMRACAQDEGESLTRRPENGWTDMVRENAFNIAISGTADGTTANKLVDSTTDFEASPVSIGDNVTNTTDDTTAVVTAVATNELTLDADIFVSGEAYTVFRQAHNFPADYKYLVDDTLWDRNFYWELRGPLSPQKWQTYKSSVLGDTATTRRRWRIHNLADEGRRFVIDPEPGEDAELVYEYMSTGWCKSAAGVRQIRWQADTDTPVLDDYVFRLGITYRLLERLGLDYAEVHSEYEDQVEAYMGRDRGGDVLRIGGPRPFSLLTTCNVPDTGFGT